MDEQKTYLSKEKHEELKDELTFLKGTRRTEIAKQLEQAKEFGDLSENAEYHEARDAQAKAEERILNLENILSNVEIVSRHKSDTVEVGVTVVIKNETTKDEKTYEIVGSEEADTAAGKISLSSPLGSALVGKKKGESFTFSAPSGKEIKIKVLKIS